MIWVLSLQIVIGLSLILMLSAYVAHYFGGMWVPSSLQTVRRMLDLADLQPGQTVVDLGAGDGRVVIMAARRYAVQAVGVEIDPLRCLLANSVIGLLGLHRRAWVYYGDVFNFDIRQADVVVMYLTKATNARLKPHLSEQLRPGTTVITRFAIPGWSAHLLDDTHMVFLYKIGKTGLDVETRLI